MARPRKTPGSVEQMRARTSAPVDAALAWLSGRRGVAGALGVAWPSRLSCGCPRTRYEAQLLSVAAFVALRRLRPVHHGSGIPCGLGWAWPGHEADGTSLRLSSRAHSAAQACDLAHADVVPLVVAAVGVGCADAAFHSGLGAAGGAVGAAALGVGGWRCLANTASPGLDLTNANVVPPIVTAVGVLGANAGLHRGLGAAGSALGPAAGLTG